MKAEANDLPTGRHDRGEVFAESAEAVAGAAGHDGTDSTIRADSDGLSAAEINGVAAERMAPCGDPYRFQPHRMGPSGRSLPPVRGDWGHSEAMANNEA
jgi:hypothetical protein